jgi:hypothetical protein
MGDFSEDCLSEASSAAAHIFEALQDTSGRGCHLLWLLSFGQAKESNSPAGRDRQIQTNSRLNTLIGVQLRE